MTSAWTASWVWAALRDAGRISAIVVICLGTLAVFYVVRRGTAIAAMSPVFRRKNERSI
jgi:hypothetical protein